MSTAPVVAVILAGGRARRFGGKPKALVSLNGKPLIVHVINRLTPQVSCVALSVAQVNTGFDYLGLEQIEDPEPGVQGPLPALLAALRWLKGLSRPEWLQLAPCDTPYLPADLTRCLMQQAFADGAPGAVPLYEGELQPACALWHRDLLTPVQHAVAHGKRGFKEFLEDNPLSVLAWSKADSDFDPFFNINTPEDLAVAGNLGSG